MICIFLKLKVNYLKKYVFRNKNGGKMRFNWFLSQNFLLFEGDLASNGKLIALVINSYQTLPYYLEDLRSKQSKN